MEKEAATQPHHISEHYVYFLVNVSIHLIFTGYQYPYQWKTQSKGRLNQWDFFKIILEEGDG